MLGMWQMGSYIGHYGTSRGPNLAETTEEFWLQLNYDDFTALTRKSLSFSPQQVNVPNQREQTYATLSECCCSRHMRIDQGLIDSFLLITGYFDGNITIHWISG